MFITGGTATFSGGMQLGVSASGIGSVTLSGGKVVTPSILAGGDGTALFAEQTATCSLIVSGAEIAGQNAVGRITQSEGFQSRRIAEPWIHDTRQRHGQAERR